MKSPGRYEAWAAGKGENAAAAQDLDPEADRRQSQAVIRSYSYEEGERPFVMATAFPTNKHHHHVSGPDDGHQDKALPADIAYVKENWGILQVCLSVKKYVKSTHGANEDPTKRLRCHGCQILMSIKISSKFLFFAGITASLSHDRISRVLEELQRWVCHCRYNAGSSRNFSALLGQHHEQSQTKKYQRHDALSL